MLRMVAERLVFATVTAAFTVSEAVNLGITAAPAGSFVAETVTVRVSPLTAAPDKNVPVKVAVAVSPVRIAAVEAEIASVSACDTACDGATERTPRPNAATATSATRLNVVFVDICFLSIVEPRTIRDSA